MKGKILGAGAISGEDGVRYYYDEKELKNLKEGQKLEGCEVDFDIKDGKAVGVYITKGGGFNADFGKIGAKVSASLEKGTLPKFDSKHIFWDLNGAKANIFGANIHSVKLFLFLSMLCLLFGFLVFPVVLSVVFMLWGTLYLGKLSGSYKPFKYPLFLLVLSIVLLGFWAFIMKDYQKMPLGGGAPYIKIIFAAIFALVTIYVAFLWCKVLSTITKEKIFVVSFIVGMIALVFCIIEIQPSISLMIEALDADTSDKMFRFARQMEKNMKLGFAGYMSWLFALASIGLFAYATLKFREIKQIS